MPIYKMDGRKDGKQKYRVRINYVDDYGRSKQIDRVAYGLDEAKQLERELNYQIKQEKPAEKITIEKLFEEYIKAKKFELRESTLDKKQRILKFHVLPYLSDVKIDKLNVAILQEWKNNIAEQGLSIRTRKNVYSEFRAMLNFAVKMEYIERNPLLKVGNFQAPLEEVKEMDFYTEEEFLKYIRSAKEYCIESEKSGDLYNWNYYVFFCIAFYTGLRKGEINALTWNDIKNNSIAVTKSVCQQVKGDDRITPPKNKSSIRTIQIPLPLIEVLAQHKAKLKKQQIFNADWFICGGEKSIRNTSIDNMNRLFSKLAEVKTIRIHDFRHSHASLLANAGINIQEIARRLGHSNISITLQTYSHLYPSEKERALNVLNNIKI